MSDSPPTLDTCRREIEQLHQFFVDWYTGRTQNFTRMERVIGSEFEMVTPDADVLGRNAVLEMVRDGRDNHDPGAFDIDIRAVTLLDSTETHAVVRYEEWQTSPDGEDGRISTVVFRPDSETPNGLVWVTVHETWLDSP